MLRRVYMRIVALSPPFLKNFSREARSPAVAKSGTFYYPMWLAYTTGYLEKNGHTVKLIDAVAEDLSAASTVGNISNFNPDMVVIDTSTPSIYNDIHIAEEIKKALPSSFVVLVGPHVSACPVESLQISDAIDAVTIKEYDTALLQLANKLEAFSSKYMVLNGIGGIAYRNSKNEICVNRESNFIIDLDVFPFVTSVYKKHLKIEKYFYSHSRYPVVSLVTGRGCPFKCTYCVLPQTLHGHTLRRRSIANVICEFLYIADQLPNIKEIMLEDDSITADKERCREFAYSLLEARATTIPWSANARADLDFGTLLLLRKAGCRLLCVGIESGDQNILDNVRKGTTINGIEKFIIDAKKAGILIHGCFMVGNRGETRDSLEKTLKFAKSLNPDTAQFFPLMVYPGTSDFEYFQSKGWITTLDFRKWITPEGLHSSVVSNPDLSYEELMEFCYNSRLFFYLRPGYISSKVFQVLRSPSEGPRVLKAFGSLIHHINKAPRKE
jgi:anaerobic magnesium-protoporphyrin IX monomethyl ester cyclase